MEHTWTLEKPDNLPEMFEASIKKNANNRWFGTKNSNGAYEWVTYADVGKRVANLRGGMANLGIKKGDTVAIIANNRVEWAICAYATYGLGARFVPMYEAELIQIWKYIIKDSNTKLVYVSKASIYDQIKDWVKEIDGLEHIILLEGDGKGTMAELEEAGKKNPVDPIFPDSEDIAGLIYTSGTTGDPKGVLLSHGNLSSNVHMLNKAYPQVCNTTISLSFLPWAHSYGQTVELHTFMNVGAATGFAESTQTIVDDLAIVKPTMLVAVPRIFNKVYDGVMNTFNEAGGLKKFLFDTGLEAAKNIREAKGKGQSPSIFDKIKLGIIDSIVFSKIREKFGGRLEFCFSSSAAISTNIINFFFDIGLNIYEAWGMTELSPAAAVNLAKEYRVGTVGKALDKVKFVIDKSMMEEDSIDGELIVYGPNVMKGYHNKPEQTKETMTDDGGLRTGDRAYIDDDGFLVITGRIKEQFKLENGKFVFPAAIEEEIKLIPYVDQAMIYGLNKPYTVCLVIPDFEFMKQYCKDHKLPVEPAEIAKHPDIQKLYEDEIMKQLSGKFGRYEIPKKFLIADEGFSVDNGMLTQTLKLKRRIVLKKYQDAIDALYDKR